MHSKPEPAKQHPWLQSLGSSVNFWDAEFFKRQERTACDGFLSRNGCYRPTYRPAANQVQAGFSDDHRFQYCAVRQIFTCFENDADPIDIRHGTMALRLGDRVSHGESVLEIDAILDAHRALAHFVSANEHGRGDVDDGSDDALPVGGWCFQRLAHAVDNAAKNASSFELIWRPPLGFLDVDHAIPPGGQWQFVLTPENAQTFKRRAVESIDRDIRAFESGRPSLAGDVDFRVEEMQLYVYTVQGERFDDGSWFLDLQHTACQQQVLPNDCTDLVTRNFEVHPWTDRLAVAFQDQMNGADTRYSRSKFKIRPGPLEPGVSLSTHDGQDMLLERFYLQYGRQVKPSPDFGCKYTSYTGDSTRAHTGYFLQGWLNSFLQSDVFHKEGGGESFSDWKNRGPYYLFDWPKDGMDKSTRAAVTVQFGRPFGDDQQPFVTLFSQWHTAYQIEHVNGRMKVSKLEEL